MKDKNEKFYCCNCKVVEIPEPVWCCDGRECGCMGLPIDPPFCSEKCGHEYYDKKNNGEMAFIKENKQ